MKYQIIIPKEEPKQDLRKYPLTPDECFKQETIKEAVREYVIYNFDSSLLDIDDHEEKVIAFAKWMHDYKADINKVYELFEQFKKK
jgi:formaldehyde-activating enzyme involved in methanogenesis